MRRSSASKDEAVETNSDSTAGAASDSQPPKSLHSLRRFLWKASIPVTVGVSLAVFGLQAIHSILLSRLLGPTGRGEYGTMMFYTQTMLYIGLLGTHYSIARCANQPHTHPAALQRAAFRTGLITGLFSMGCALLLACIGLPSNKQYLLGLCCVCVLLLPAEHLRLTAQAVDHGRGKFNRYNFSRLVAASVFPILILVFYLLQLKNLTLIAWSTVFVSVAAYLFYWLMSDTKWLFARGRPSSWKIIRDGSPDAGLVLAHDMYDRISILIVLWVVSLADQGLYLTALPIASLLVVAPNALELFAFRVATDPDHRLTRRRFLHAVGAVMLVQLVVLVSLQLVLAPLIVILFGSDFSGAIPVARVLVCASALSGITIVGEGYLRGRQRARAGIYIRCLALLTMVVCALSLNSLAPLLRIATATVLGYAVNTVLVGWYVFKESRPTMDSSIDSSD